MRKVGLSEHSMKEGRGDIASVLVAHANLNNGSIGEGLLPCFVLV